MSDDWDVEGVDEEDAMPPREGRRRSSPPRREAFALLYCIIALSFVYFHGAVRSLPQPWPLFTWFAANFLVLFCVPAAITGWRWRQSLSLYGLRWGDVGVWGRYFVAYAGIMVPIILLASRMPQFQAYYPRCAPARDSVGWLLFSGLGWLVYFFAWEWFFRGFMLFSLAPRYGGAIAILMQTIPFAMMHFPKLEAEAWSSIITGIALGLMAFRGQSFLGCWLLHWAVQFMMDVMVVAWPLES